MQEGLLPNIEEREPVGAATRLWPGPAVSPNATQLQTGHHTHCDTESESAPARLTASPSSGPQSCAAKPPNWPGGDAETIGEAAFWTTLDLRYCSPGPVECLIRQSHQRLSGRIVVLSSLRVASQACSRPSCGRDTLVSPVSPQARTTTRLLPRCVQREPRGHSKMLSSTTVESCEKVVII